MGVDISFYRVNKKEYAYLLDRVGLDVTGKSAPGIDEYSAWQTLLEALEPYEVVSFCGRHFVYREVCGNIGTSDLMYPSEEAMKTVVANARDITTKWRMYNEELLQIPLRVVERLVAETVKAGEVMVTIPLESRSDYGDWVDDADWYQASRFVEVEEVLTDLDEDEEVVVVLSY